MKALEYKIRANESDFEAVRIANASDVDKFIRPIYEDGLNVKEMMFSVFLDHANNTTGYYKVSEGSGTQTVFDVKAIVKCAIDTMACGVVLVHNHPSGDVEPSRQDKDVTQRLKDALKMYDMCLLDHIIVSGRNDTYYSFLDKGTL